ncbi:MAG: hypothetical protein WED09_12230 [Homoserinimonas sp.]
MPLIFGPQLIGQTEKTLNALLKTILGDQLTEAQWVTLRIAQLLESRISSNDALARAVSDRAHFSDARALVGELTTAGLLDGGQLTRAGEAVVSDIELQIAERTDPVWAGLSPEDVAAASRVLNEVLRRARSTLAQA